MKKKNTGKIDNFRPYVRSKIMLLEWIRFQ